MLSLECYRMMVMLDVHKIILMLDKFAVMVCNKHHLLMISLLIHHQKWLLLLDQENLVIFGLVLILEVNILN
jgi:hypothetical protein